MPARMFSGSTDNQTSPWASKRSTLERAAGSASSNRPINARSQATIQSCRASSQPCTAGSSRSCASLRASRDRSNSCTRISTVAQNTSASARRARSSLVLNAATAVSHSSNTSRWAERQAHAIAVPDLGGRGQFRTTRPLGSEGVTKPACSFDIVTVDEPQPRHSRRQRQRPIGIATCDEPVERGPQVAQVRGEAFSPHRPGWRLAGPRGPPLPSAGNGRRA